MNEWVATLHIDICTNLHQQVLSHYLLKEWTTPGNVSFDFAQWVKYVPGTSKMKMPHTPGPTGALPSATQPALLRQLNFSKFSPSEPSATQVPAGHCQRCPHPLPSTSIGVAFQREGEAPFPRSWDQ